MNGNKIQAINKQRETMENREIEFWRNAEKKML
jgi:hypothetical protein